MAFISIYLEGNLPIDPYLQTLRNIRNKLTADYFLIGGDANAWSPWWGSRVEDVRGDVLLGFIDELGLDILNRGNVPTFDTVRGTKRYTSCVDITVCSPPLTQMISDWRVVTGMITSDHNAIMYEVRREKMRMRENNNTRKYNTKKVDWDRFMGSFEIC